ncbi:Chaperone DnaJ, C-terminal, partial [Cynara cardunculus var. scolymus]
RDGDGDGDGAEREDVTSPRVTAPRFTRTASTGFLPSSLPKTTSQRRSKTPGRLRPVNSLLRSFSKKGMDSNSFHAGHVDRSSSVSRRHSSTIVYSNANGLRKPPDMVKRLECTLEDLCFGCIKNVKIKRDVLTSEGYCPRNHGTASGHLNRVIHASFTLCRQIIQEDEVLTIKVKPGWKKGTKITFEGMGNETPGTCAADITFVVDEKRHPVFKRKGDDLEVAVELPLVDALTGCTLTIPFLDGQQSCLLIEDVITPGCRKSIVGQGMTLPTEEAKRGNLNIKFSVQFPQQLTEEQRS